MLPLANINAAEDAPRGFGRWVSGGYFIGKVEPGSRVGFDGQAIEVDEQGYYLLGFDRDSQGEKSLSIVRAGEEADVFQVEIEKRDFDIQRIDGLDPSRVEPPTSVMDRILFEAEQVRRARRQEVGSIAWRTPFVWPSMGPISGVYGSQRILNGKPQAPHWGIDIAVSTGTPVHAPAAGEVTLAEPDLYYSGGTVILNHGGTLSSSFLHLSRLDVEVGDWVDQGQLLGAVGSTGRSTGPHLDWRINAAQQRIDVGLWVPPMDELCEPEGSGIEAVVLLHGLGRTDRSMRSLAESLRQAGYATCNQGYPSRSASLPQLAGYAANAVERMRQEGYGTVHLVTHSMGGIMARYWLQQGRLPGKGRLVMLSPPNHGSEVIDAFGRYQWFQRLMGPAAMELATDDEAMVNQMSHVNAVPVGILTGERSSDPWFNFLFDGKHDGKVSVESARLSEAQGFRVVDSGHTFIMNDPEVRFLVAFFLTNGFFP